MPELDWRGIRFPEPQPLLDGAVPDHGFAITEGNRIIWPLGSGERIELAWTADDARLTLKVSLEGAASPIDSLGLRFEGVRGARSYLRNGYQSWDGSYFVAPGTPAGDGPAAKAPTSGFACTALLPHGGGGALVLGADRHDRFQSRFRFGGTAEALTLDVETLLDRVPHDGRIEAETLVLLHDDDVEGALRTWSHLVAGRSPLPPRLPKQRLTGWCSWYNLYAAIDEASITDHLEAARDWRDRTAAPLDIFLIDDGFTPEMGDWLDVKPQFPRGIAPLLTEIRAAGFLPGLWIAPFLVGNRSQLAAEHPDWLVQERDGDRPLVHMHFYGEFRWHKRSEQYHVLDVTHPGAAAYIRAVFRTWRREWGASYFKTDFMNAGMEYGPDRARWHDEGRSRVDIWRSMATIIREEIGDALWLGCGCPLWASVGLVDAVRIGRDIGVSWTGDYSAESLIRDLATRSHAHNVLWQADPDCVLLRERFHDLNEEQVRSLALLAGLSGGVLMTSDHLGEIGAVRSALFESLLKAGIDDCRFPELGSDRAVMRQDGLRVGRPVATNLFNPTDQSQTVADGAVLGPYASQVEGLEDAAR